ncbi:MAG: hypothetical protein AB1458_15725 [Bacteroidota bacterium]
MKTLKTILTALSITALLVFVNGFSTPAMAENQMTMHCDGEGGVTDAQVIAYLESYGYKNVTIVRTLIDGDRIAQATSPVTGKQVNIYVNVEAGAIVGFEEINN